MKTERERYLAMLLELLAEGTPAARAAIRLTGMVVTDTQPDDLDWRVLEMAQMGGER